MWQGILAGIVSGIIVSISSVLLHHRRKPVFELRYANQKTLTLIYHRLTPIVIGGTWGFEIGNDLLSTPDERAASSGIVLPAFGQKNLTNQCDLEIGTSIVISYKRLRLYPVRTRKKILKALNWSQEPDALLELLDTRRSRAGWRVKSVEIHQA